MNFFYIYAKEYASVDIAAAAIYLFLKKNVLFNHAIVILSDTLSEDEKKTFLRLYHRTQILPENTIPVDNWREIPKYDFTLSSEMVKKNTPLLEEYNKWKKGYAFDDSTSFAKNFEDEDKYVVFTCAKNENDYIIEWIEHYLSLGFDKIIICDNNDNNSLETIVDDYVKRGAVEIFNCHGFSNFQEEMFRMYCEEGNYKWCAYFDCDEFLELGVYSNIKDYLAKKTEDCMAFNWVIFGSNGKIDKEEGKLSERFNTPFLPILNIYNGFLKGIVRGGRFRFRNVAFRGGHLPYPLDKEGQENTYNIGGYFPTGEAPYQASYPLRYKEGYIKHYYTKSFEEWIDKARRGWPIETGSLPFYRYFTLENVSDINRGTYDKNLFLKDEWFEDNSGALIEFLKTHDIVELAHEKTSLYAFVSFVLYLMNKVTGKIILIKSDRVDDFLFAILLEYSFVTGNRVVYCDNDEEVNSAFIKYMGKNNPEYLWEVL